MTIILMMDTVIMHIPTMKNVYLMVGIAAQEIIALTQITPSGVLIKKTTMHS